MVRVTFARIEHTRFNMFNMSMGQHVDKSTMVTMGSSSSGPNFIV